jgi:group I intron endonuclease
MEKLSGVYEIVNTLNGKRYIGSSVSVYRRLEDHKRSLRKGTSRHNHLQSAFNKYGESNFIFRPIIYCDSDMTLIYEQACIDTLRPEYNGSTCAEASMRGYKMTEEQKEKLSMSRRGFRHSEETKAKMSAARKGHPVSEETRAKLRAANIGKNVSLETRAKIGDISRGRVMSEESRLRMSAAQKGIPMSTEEKAILTSRMIGNKYALGYKPSDETKKKLSDINKGRKPTEEQREKLSEALKLRWERARLKAAQEGQKLTRFGWNNEN